MSINVQGISKHYGAQKALDQVSFELNKGEVVGFLGPNGAGKTTMMRILATSLNADAGSATVGGHDVAGKKRAVQKILGYLPEHNPLYTDMYVREYLRFSATLHKIPKSRVEAAIERTGLSPEAHKKIGQLSKGYRQRVGLAAAIQHDPEVLVLDEPTTGLDPNQLTDIRALIKDLGREKTVLLSTHILQEVEAICDRVVIISRGKIVADKTRSELKDEKEQLIAVEFDYRVETELLERLPYILSVENTDGFVYELTFSTEKDMRSTVFDFAHDNELKILQLHRKNKSLEQLFGELTTNPAPVQKR